ncbi:retropepsin-like aspartic protease [Autumnicola musiva]|uniref:Retropepsin-like aspartic protease n=1 Tax=Autumnicola musiva TaxID=3075589 RepID=A0ABU3D5D2_9FLAO|nr:retropepsin-like aspartic protease [Zunongwangia sp. F117]MDT0676741.1 retropepsin-like aspartic protease [Zunongwangia sp. F117]
MTKLITYILILFTSLSYSQQIPKQVNIPFTQTPNGHIIIPATINGVEGSFIFDTGAGINLLTKKFADKITDLKETNHFYTGHRATGEEIKSDLWNSKYLEIGNFKIKNEIFAVYDLEFPLDGLISLTPFKDRQITIDFKNKILSIESEKSLNELITQKDFEMPLQISNDREIKIGISTKVTLNDKLSLNVGLDSGAGFDVYRFNSEYMELLDIDSTKIHSEFKPSIFKPEEGNSYYYTNLAELTDSSKNVSVKDFKATFIDGLIYEGIMGINWIGEMITIDIPNKRLIVRNYD